MRYNNLAAAVALARFAAAQSAENSGIQGFNSGAFTTDFEAKKQDDFEKEMTAAQNLQGTPGLFNSMRLYTNIQYETDDTPIEAFQAAINTNTTLLLGLWASEVKSVDNELSALKSAIEDLGEDFANLVVGISVGSEDLYRSSESGIKNEAGVGADPDTIVDFIKDTRKALKGTLLEDKPIGHVDAWSAWGNKSNEKVLKEVDWVGTDLYPYYEDDKGNSFDNLTNVWDYIHGTVFNATEKANKPLWITETGYPHTGPEWGDAVASVENAQAYWQQIGCSLFGRTNVWWYNLGDSNPENDEKFALNQEFDNKPKFDLTCPDDSGAPAAINLDSASSVTTSSFGFALAVVTANVLALTL